MAGIEAGALKSPAAEIAGTLESSRIVDVRRVGKHIVFDLESGAGPQFRKSRSKKKKSWALQGGRGRPPYTDQSPVDCTSGDDWRMLVCESDAEIEKPHARCGEAGFGEGVALVSIPGGLDGLAFLTTLPLAGLSRWKLN